MGNDDATDFGGLGSPMNPPTFDAGSVDGADSDAGSFAIDLPADDDPLPPPETSMETPSEEPSPTPAGSFADVGGGAKKRGAVMDLPIDIIVSVGRARPSLTDLVELRRDSVLTLESRIDDPVELIVGDRVIARGELQEIDPASGRLGVRLTEVADPQEGL